MKGLLAENSLLRDSDTTIFTGPRCPHVAKEEAKADAGKEKKDHHRVDEEYETEKGGDQEKPGADDGPGSQEVLGSLNSILWNVLRSRLFRTQVGLLQLCLEIEQGEGPWG